MLKEIKEGNSGSALVLITIVTMVAILIATSIGAVSLYSKKSGDRVKRSAKAIQSADAALEWAFLKIEKRIRVNDLKPYEITIKEVFENFDSNKGYVEMDNSLAKIYFIKEELVGGSFVQEVITDQDYLINDVSRIRAVGVDSLNEKEVVSRALDSSISPPTCSMGTTQVADFCIDEVVTPFSSSGVLSLTSMKEAYEYCAKFKGHLCTAGERAAAFFFDLEGNNNPELQIDDDGEIVGDFISEDSYAKIKNDGSDSIAFDQVTNDELNKFRCCYNR